tara:strand:+ start:307 stop:477 length:171 start_codon:yes stop_codon:yes gene_type:complete
MKRGVHREVEKKIDECIAINKCDERKHYWDISISMYREREKERERVREKERERERG